MRPRRSRIPTSGHASRRVTSIGPDASTSACGSGRGVSRLPCAACCACRSCAASRGPGRGAGPGSGRGAGRSAWWGLLVLVGPVRGRVALAVVLAGCLVRLAVLLGLVRGRRRPVAMAAVGGARRVRCLHRRMSVVAVVGGLVALVFRTAGTPGRPVRGRPRGPRDRPGGPRRGPALDGSGLGRCHRAAGRLGAEPLPPPRPSGSSPASAGPRRRRACPSAAGAWAVTGGRAPGCGPASAPRLGSDTCVRKVRPTAHVTSAKQAHSPSASQRSTVTRLPEASPKTGVNACSTSTCPPAPLGP